MERIINKIIVNLFYWVLAFLAFKTKTAGFVHHDCTTDFLFRYESIEELLDGSDSDEDVQVGNPCILSRIFIRLSSHSFNLFCPIPRSLVYFLTILKCLILN